MGRIIAVVILLIGVIISFMFFPDLMTSTHDVLTDEQTLSSTSVTTGAGVTTSSLWLSRGLYNDDYNNVVSIASTNGNDTPFASAYSATSQNLTVSGLQASSSRDLTTIYEFEATADYTGMTTTVELAPTLLVLAILMIVLGGLYFGVRHAIGRSG